MCNVWILCGACREDYSLTLNKTINGLILYARKQHCFLLTRQHQHPHYVHFMDIGIEIAFIMDSTSIPMLGWNTFSLSTYGFWLESSSLSTSSQPKLGSCFGQILWQCLPLLSHVLHQTAPDHNIDSSWSTQIEVEGRCDFTMQTSYFEGKHIVLGIVALCVIFFLLPYVFWLSHPGIFWKESILMAEQIQACLLCSIQGQDLGPPRLCVTVSSHTKLCMPLKSLCMDLTWLVPI